MAQDGTKTARGGLKKAHEAHETLQVSPRGPPGGLQASQMHCLFHVLLNDASILAISDLQQLQTAKKASKVGEWAAQKAPKKSPRRPQDGPTWLPRRRR